jgi:hypothetical protein
MLAREQTSALDLSVRQLRQFQDRALAHAELAVAAQAGGIPPEWIAQARERGVLKVADAETDPRVPRVRHGLQTQ